ncbi:hypothetical protein ZIOFF_018157 [Zingiber officinale]|uniref:Uncharacterized protein n=1 Tax=Zingiber officinale TaxID=94328 RepID=A0A8J5HW77_ZINOF|nr:hypothetical protein ZIOFF_018157 [Zingiber officinale]
MLIATERPPAATFLFALAQEFLVSEGRRLTRLQPPRHCGLEFSFARLFIISDQWRERAKCPIRRLDSVEGFGSGSYSPSIPSSYQQQHFLLHDTKWSDPFHCSPAHDEGKKLSLFLCDSSPVTSTETFPLLRGPGSHFAFFLRAVEAPRPLLTQTVAPSSLVDFRFRGSDRRRCVSSPSSVRAVALGLIPLIKVMPVSPILLRLGLCFWEVEKNRTKNQQPQWISQSTAVVDSWGFARFVNVGDERGETPLHLAARRKWTECVRVLLDHGALVSSSTREYGRIPYSIAIKHNHGACAAFLNPSTAEPLVWPSPLKFISEHDPDARALLEVALMDANKESEKKY